MSLIESKQTAKLDIRLIFQNILLSRIQITQMVIMALIRLILCYHLIWLEPRSFSPFGHVH